MIIVRDVALVGRCTIEYNYYNVFDWCSNNGILFLKMPFELMGLSGWLE